MSDIHKVILPNKWCLVNLDQIADFVKGVTYKKQESSTHPKQGYLSVLRANNINGSINYDELVYVPSSRISKDQKIRFNDIILAMSSGSKHLVGKAAQAKHSFNGGFGAFCGVVRPKKEISGEYLGFCFQGPHYRKVISKLSSGININNLRRDHIESLTVPLPPLNEQKRIVAKIEQLFSDLDAGVATLKAIKKQIRQYRQSVLKYAFEGKLTAEWRKRNNPEPASKLLEQIANERRQNAGGKKQKPLPPLDTSDLPELPEGWEWFRIGQLGDVTLGRQRSPKNHNGKYMRPYLRVANVFENRIDISSIYQMNFTPEEYNIFALKHGDILLNEGQSLHLVGRPAMYRNEIEGACFQNTLVRFRPVESCFSKYFLYGFLNQFYQKRYQKIARWTTSMAHLGAERFSCVEFPLCSSKEQEQIVAEIEHHFSIADKAEEVVNIGLKQSERLRQSILKQAFEGKLVPQDPTDEPAEKLLERITK